MGAGMKKYFYSDLVDFEMVVKELDTLTLSDEEKKESHWTAQYEKESAAREADINLWILYDVFKKAHRMITW